jgi:hypothetical protein
MIAVINSLPVKEGAAEQVVERFANSQGHVQEFPVFVSMEVLDSEAGGRGAGDHTLARQGCLRLLGRERGVLYTRRTRTHADPDNRQVDKRSISDRDFRGTAKAQQDMLLDVSYADRGPTKELAQRPARIRGEETVA